MTNKNDDRLFKKDGKTVNKNYIAKKRSKEKNQKLFTKKFAALLILLSIAIIVYNTYIHQYMQISQIYIRGNKRVTDTDIIAELGNPIGKNILLYNPDEYVDRIDKLDYVEEVKIKKVFPKILSINIKEDYPLFYQNMGDRDYFISNLSKTLGSLMRDQADKSSLIEIRGVNLNTNVGEEFTSSKITLDFLEEIQKYPFFAGIKQLNLENKADIGIITKDIDIEFGDLNNIDYKLKLLESILADIGKKGINVRGIDLNNIEEPIVKVDQTSFNENLNY